MYRLDLRGLGSAVAIQHPGRRGEIAKACQVGAHRLITGQRDQPEPGQCLPGLGARARGPDEQPGELRRQVRYCHALIAKPGEQPGRVVQALGLGNAQPRAEH